MNKYEEALQNIIDCLNDNDMTDCIEKITIDTLKESIKKAQAYDNSINKKHYGRIVVVEENAEDEYKSVCICPHCGSLTHYGEMMMISGTHCCPKCHDELYGTIEYLRKNHYNAYTRIGNNHEDEPYRYIGGENNGK